ncbi:hypothetical protein ACIRYZ_13890 [Kitasatospora sp. NPDC101155]|uniref:hypothetical protein n=1 Tax=Kitasatospora sp. NPDC101155 TaxID=3364097 RepID=UPI00382B78DA
MRLPGATDSGDFTPEMLTPATGYWATNAIGTSIRYYANANRHPWTPSHDHRPGRSPAGRRRLAG